MGTVKTTIVVSFDSQRGGGSLNAMLDDRETGYNKGKTQFKPGDKAYFLVFKSPGVVITNVIASAGSISYEGTGVYAVEEYLTFANEYEASLSKPFSGSPSYQWFGNSLGTISFDADAGVASIYKPTVVPPATLPDIVGMAKLNYNAPFTAYSINSPLTLNGLKTFSITALVVGNLSDA